MPLFVNAQVPIQLLVSHGQIPLSDVRVTLVEKDFWERLSTQKEPSNREYALTVTTNAQGICKIRMPQTEDSKNSHKTKSNRKYEMYWEYAFRVQYDQVDVNYYDTVNAIVTQYVQYTPRKIDPNQVIEIEIPFTVHVPRATKTIERQLDSVKKAIQTCVRIFDETQKNIDADPLSGGQRYYQQQIQTILQQLELDKVALETRLQSLKEGLPISPPAITAIDAKQKVATSVYIKGQALKHYREQTQRDKADFIRIRALQMAEKRIAEQREAAAFRLSIYEQEVNSRPDSSIQTNYASGKYEIKDLDAADKQSIIDFKNKLIQRYDRYKPILEAAHLKATIVLTVHGYTDGKGYGGTWFADMGKCDINEKNNAEDPDNQCLSALRAKGMKDEILAGLPNYIVNNHIEASHLGKGSMLAVTPAGVNKDDNKAFRKCMISTYMKLDFIK